MKLIVSPGAVADLDRLRRFLARKNETATRCAVSTLIQAIQSLDRFSDRGRPVGATGMRELIVPFGRSAYVLRYVHLPQSGDVMIVRIWHGREERD